MRLGVPAPSPRCPSRARRGSAAWLLTLKSLVRSTLPLAALGCGPQGATPVPQPPEALAPESVSLPEVTDLSTRITLVGATGATEAGWVVRATNLDDTEPSVATQAAASGSFLLPIGADDGDELRLEVVNDAGRSAPTDLRYVERRLEPVVRLDCLEFEPGLAVSLTATPVALRFRNACAVPVTLENWRWRLDLPDFTVGSPVPITVAPGESSEQTLRFVRSGSGQREDVLFVDVNGTDSAVRYAITVTAAD